MRNRLLSSQLTHKSKFRVHDLVFPTTANGELTGGAAHITDIGELDGIIYYSITGTNTYYPESQLIPLIQVKLRFPPAPIPEVMVRIPAAYQDLFAGQSRIRAKGMTIADVLDELINRLSDEEEN